VNRSAGWIFQCAQFHRPESSETGFSPRPESGGFCSRLFVIVSLPDAAVKESRDRVSTALTNSGFKCPVDSVRQKTPEANFAKSSA
jgi:hypothetical protein